MWHIEGGCIIMTTIFESHESQVRSYCRAFPAVFNKAIGASLYDEAGRRYIDFFAGAGTLNYGHNNPLIKRKLVGYLMQDGIIHGLDLYTTAKREFLETLESVILRPRGLNYKIQFPGPTGTNAVEAAMKLARKATGRDGIVAFTNGYHGMTAGALAATGNTYHRQISGGLLNGVTFAPYDGYFGPDVNTVSYLRKLIEDASSGLDKPAAVMLETVQGEGGVNVASFQWLREVEALCREHDILLIVDDIQAGNGRTGTFFSFKPAGVTPDIVTLSKSIGAYGLPMSLVLMKPELDCWEPGEHNGTFRGNNLAFVAATEAIRIYWTDNTLSLSIQHKAHLMRRRLRALCDELPAGTLSVRGRGLFVGLSCDQNPTAARLISAEAFRRGVILETCGGRDQVVKFLPPLIIEENMLEEGLEIVMDSIRTVMARLDATGTGAATGSSNQEVNS
jgi:diaminobutyrate-2-oxoglutarate transaminase